MADMTASLELQVTAGKATADLKQFRSEVDKSTASLHNLVAESKRGEATDISAPWSRMAMRVNSATKAQEDFNARWGNTLRLGQQVGAGVTAAGVGIAAGLGKAYQAASQFDQAMRNVNSIAKLNTQEFGKLTESVKGIASDSKVRDSAQTLAAGLYDIYSSGLQGAQALEALEVASKGASAGMSNTATASNVLVAAMNAYDRKGPGEASKIMDVLFKTVEKGVVTFDQLAGTLGNVMGTAAQVGVPIEELGAAVSTMTKQGIGAEEAVTSLNGILMQFLSPSKDFADAIKNAGYESGLAVIEARGLAGAVEFLTEATGGNKDVMAQMLGNVRAIRGAMALTGAGAQTFTLDLREMQGAAGAMGAALDEQSKGALFRQQVAMKNLGLAAINMGETLKKAVATAAPVLSSLLGIMSRIAATPLGQALTLASAAVAGLALAIGPLLIVLPNAIHLWQLLSAAVGAEGFAAVASATAARVLPALKAAIGSVIVRVQEAIIATQAFTVALLEQGLSGALSTAMQGLQAFGKSIIAELSTPAGAVVASLAGITLGISLLRDMARDARDNLKKLNDEIGITQKLGGNAPGANGASPEAQQRIDLTRQIEELNQKRAQIRGVLDQARLFGVITSVGREIGGMEGIRAYEDYYKELGRQRDQLLQQRNAVGKRAAGGPVVSGRPYIVGERGPELFVPQSSGSIMSNRNTQMLAGSSKGSQQVVIVNVNGNIYGDEHLRRTAREEIAGAVRSASYAR